MKMSIQAGQNIEKDAMKGCKHEDKEKDPKVLEDQLQLRERCLIELSNIVTWMSLGIFELITLLQSAGYFRLLKFQ